jgi:hypothetical protein
MKFSEDPSIPFEHSHGSRVRLPRDVKRGVRIRIPEQRHEY